ncbi:DUF3108 domain-containing protein [Alteromonas pelagimontana]|uniref:DUF3108 domain-containing protein n=1 Tax=Alteromonas pelagimontana TaxID=1858656 RepID=A0A6M4MBZ1_9ALTE|nr:DUF3108 domain-containing protein [Alteromonas pelagimontana]QJR80701.1 DUF3108 domain-containing protein [Alteromonas pelagimontana]
MKKVTSLRLLYQLSLIMLIVAAPAFAQSPASETSDRSDDVSDPLNRYQIRYNVTRDGDNYGKATRELAVDDEGTYQLSTYFTASILFYDIERREKARFVVEDKSIVPLKYTLSDSRTFKRTKNTAYLFDPSAHTVKGAEGEAATSVPEKIYDPLLVYEALRVAVSRGLRGDTTFNVYDGGKPEQFHFTYNGSETIETSLGKFETEKFTRVRETSARKTAIWFATSVNYLPVQVTQENEGDEQATLTVAELNLL